MKTVAIIPIKLHNLRLPGKNLMPLGDQPLCQYLFNTIKDIDELDEKYVYCSDDSIKKYMPNQIRYIKREKSLDSDSIKSKAILDAFAEEVYADIYVLLHVTQPFIKKETIIEGIKRVKSGGYDSSFCAYEIREFAWFEGKPLNYSLNNVVRTQELQPVYTEGEMFIFKREVLKEQGRRIGNKPYIVPIDWKESICIDTKADFELAELVVEKGKNERKEL